MTNNLPLLTLVCGLICFGPAMAFGAVVYFLRDSRPASPWTRKKRVCWQYGSYSTEE